MAVRNCREIGENLQKIMNRLMSNDKLVNLLYYTDKDPLSQMPLTAEDKQNYIFNKRIKIIPRVDQDDTAQSTISIRVVRGNNINENEEFKKVIIAIEVFTPLTQWFIKDTNLRPFAILGEIQDSLNKKTINGLGKMVGGDFALNFLTDEISCYEQEFEIISYD